MRNPNDKNPGRLVLAILAGAAPALLTAVTPAAIGQETSKDVVAVQVRKQGYPCATPLNAERDMAASKPGEAVWVLQCDNGTYRVRLNSDMAAQIERVN